MEARISSSAPFRPWSYLITMVPGTPGLSHSKAKRGTVAQGMRKQNIFLASLWVCKTIISALTKSNQFVPSQKYGDLKYCPKPSTDFELSCQRIDAYRQKETAGDTVIAENLGHVNIRGPQLFYLFFHALDESSSFCRTICGLELCFVVFVSNNQCFDFIIICNII